MGLTFLILGIICVLTMVVISISLVRENATEMLFIPIMMSFGGITFIICGIFFMPHGEAYGRVMYETEYSSACTDKVCMVIIGDEVITVESKVGYDAVLSGDFEVI